MIATKLAIKDAKVRHECTTALHNMLKKDDDGLLDFKLDILKEIHTVVKTKDHSLLSPNLLDCLVLHDIMVDETKARAIDASSKKSQEMHDRLVKLRKKGKYNDYRELKQQLLTELKETDALGADLAKVSTVNNSIVKETLAIYFEILKQKDSSPLLRSVFLGIPQFCKYINVEIVFDLLSVMREYFKV
jgi:hypothetical protein